MRAGCAHCGDVYWANYLLHLASPEDYPGNAHRGFAVMRPVVD